MSRTRRWRRCARTSSSTSPAPAPRPLSGPRSSCCGWPTSGRSLHGPDRLDPAEAASRVGRRRGGYGGDGTPEVSEFAAAELGARIGRSPYAAARLMADALDLHHRHPQLWERVRGRRGAGLLRPARGRPRPATSSPRRRPTSTPRSPSPRTGGSPGRGSRRWSRPRSRRPHPRSPGRGRSRPRRRRFAKKLRDEAHGMASFMVRADVATIDQIDAAVTATAAAHRRRPCPMPDRRRRRATGPRRAADGQPRRDARDRSGRPAARPCTCTCTPTPEPDDPRPRGHRPARGPRPGHRGLDHPTSSARAPVQDPARCSTWPARRRWTPMRSRSDIDRPCI